MAPLGYLNNKETKQIYVDKEKSPLIKKAFETYSTGKYTLKEIRKIINGLERTARFFAFRFQLSIPFAKPILLWIDKV